MSRVESCPVQSCTVSGTLQRVLCHLRQSHDPNDVPISFTRRLSLSQCQLCRKWFVKLGQHMSQCKKSQPTTQAAILATSSSSSSTCRSSSQDKYVSNHLASPTDESVIQNTFEDEQSLTCEDKESLAWTFIRDATITDILNAAPSELSN